MDAGLQRVADYIRKFTIDAFNLQYGMNVLWSDFEIVSIPPRYGKHCGFEITNIDVNVDFKIHIHSNIGLENTIDEFWLLAEENYSASAAEKVYVAYAEFSEEILFLNNNFIRRECPHFPSSYAQLNCIIDETYTVAVLGEDGTFVMYEEAVAI